MSRLQLLVKAVSKGTILASLALLSVCATLQPVDAHRRHYNAQPPDPRDTAFDRFVTNFRSTALANMISSATYAAAMRGVHRNARIEVLNQEQPEFVKPIWFYLDSAASPLRASQGQRKLTQESSTLAAIENKYGVPPEVLVSIWGNETNFGSDMGGFNMFEALATLAYDGARVDFARRELLAALKIVQQENLDPKQMVSSWAGAFGQMQMLPSTFVKSAVDGDGDGKRDLWHSPADALASAASELSIDGWQRGHVWGYKVLLPADFPYELAEGETLKPIADWTKLGVRAVDGSELPPNVETGAIYVPAGMRGPAFMAFSNFKVILKYNNAVSYALAVCELSDLIAGRPGIQASWPREEQPLSRDERIAFQKSLVVLGFDPGRIDGVLGRNVKAALRLYQKAHGIPADGFPTLGLLTALLMEARQKQL